MSLEVVLQVLCLISACDAHKNFRSSRNLEESQISNFFEAAGSAEGTGAPTLSAVDGPPVLWPRGVRAASRGGGRGPREGDIFEAEPAGPPRADTPPCLPPHLLRNSHHAAVGSQRSFCRRLRASDEGYVKLRKLEFHCFESERIKSFFVISRVVLRKCLLLPGARARTAALTVPMGCLSDVGCWFRSSRMTIFSFSNG